MIRQISTIVGLIVGAAVFADTTPCPPPPVIRCNPQTQTVVVGNPVTFTVQAENPPDVHEPPWFTYQWQTQSPGGSNFDYFVDIPSATNSTYTIAIVSTNSDSTGPALFRVRVSSIHDVAITSLVAGLQVASANLTNAFPVPVYGSPYLTKGFCCGHSYVAAVSFVFQPNHLNGNTFHTAKDLTRTDTTLEGWDYNGSFYYCDGPTSCPNTHTFTPEDQYYNFTIYFPNNPPVTGQLYPIYPTGYK